MICTPCYGGQLHEGYLHGILRFLALAKKENVHVHINTLGNESLITRARNTLVSDFLDLDEKDKSKFTHLMFIDSDIEFNESAIMNLILSKHDIATGIYPGKMIDWDFVKLLAKNNDLNNLEERSLKYNINLAKHKDIKIKDGFIEVLDAATGFMCIKKEVFYKLKDKFPNLKYTNPQFRNGKTISSNNNYAFFDCSIDEKTNYYLSEDYSFCRLCQKIGIKIYANITIPLTHWGTYPFKGNVSTQFNIKK